MSFPGLRLLAAKIPPRWEDATPAWMSDAIASRCPGARVAALELLTRDDGTNRRARFALRYAAGAGPATVFLKAHSPHHRWVHLRNGNLFNEARLFASGVALPVRQVLPRRAVTSVRLHRTPLLRLGGVSLLIVAAPGAKLFLPAIPAPQAGLLAHILAEDAP